MRLIPVDLKTARRFIGEHHRHAIPPRGWKFGVGLEHEGELVGVGVASRPVARHSDDGITLEVIRVCTLGHPNAASMIYGALARAAKALGYQRLITYTLEHEPGISPRAAGFTEDGATPPRKAWVRSEGLIRHQTDLFGNDRRDTGPKTRWIKEL